MGVTISARRDAIKPSRKDNKQVSLPLKFTARLLDDCDARLAVIKNIRSRYHILSEACGGNESPQRDLLAKRIAFLAILIESAEVTAAEEGYIDQGVYVQSVNALTGLLKTVGLDKRIKSAKDLSAYLAEKERKSG